jgi:radical SAM superfamily enzyme
MVATSTINRLKKTLQKKLQHIQKQYCCVCLTGCNSRNREIANNGCNFCNTAVANNESIKALRTKTITTSVVIIVATPAINRLQTKM